MTWNHLFTRMQGNAMDPNIIDLEYGIRKEKLDYLAQKFRDLSNYRTLYILAYPEPSNELETIEPNLITLIRLRNAITKIRGNANFDLLYCSLYKKFDDFDNLMNRVIVNPEGGYFFEGDYECWHRYVKGISHTARFFAFYSSRRRSFIGNYVNAHNSVYNL